MKRINDLQLLQKAAEIYGTKRAAATAAGVNRITFHRWEQHGIPAHRLRRVRDIVARPDYYKQRYGLDKPKMSVEERRKIVDDALLYAGGIAKLADMLGVKRQRVYSWGCRGAPEAWAKKLLDLMPDDFIAGLDDAGE